MYMDKLPIANLPPPCSEASFAKTNSHDRFKFYVPCKLSTDIRKQFEFMQLLLALIIAHDDVVSVILASSKLHM